MYHLVIEVTHISNVSQIDCNLLYPMSIRRFKNAPVRVGLFCLADRQRTNSGDLNGQSFTGPAFARIWHIAEVVALFPEGDLGYENRVVVHSVFGGRGGRRCGGRGVRDEERS